MSVTKKYGDFIGVALLVLVGLFLAAVYFEFLDIGWEQTWVFAGVVGVIAGFIVGQSYQSGDKIPLIIGSLVVSGLTIAITQGLLFDWPPQFGYIGGATYLYGLITGKLL